MDKVGISYQRLRLLYLFSTCTFTVYLRADPLTCQQRIKKRDRMEEKSVPIVSNLLEIFDWKCMHIQVYKKCKMYF